MTRVPPGPGASGRKKKAAPPAIAEQAPAPPSPPATPGVPPAQPGVACPACGCRHVPTLYTRRFGKDTVRVRECRYCGRRIRTREEIVNTNQGGTQ